MKTRIVEIDIIRGFIILLVFAGNLDIFSGVTTPYNPIDTAIKWFLHVVIDGTVYSTFAFLFGLGLTLQQYSDWQRRMLLLIGIGCIHGVIVNQGDILAIYGLFGLILYRMRNWSKLGLFCAAIALLAIPAATNFSMWLAAIPQMNGSGAPADVRFSQGIIAIFQARVEQWLTLYLPGSLVFTFPNIFAAMMLGVAAGKHGFKVQGFTVLNWPLWCIYRVGLVGLCCMAAYGTIRTFASDGAIIAYANGLATIGAPCLGALYIWGIVWLSTRYDMRSFASAGRMSLTLYVQSGLIGSLLAYAGLYGLMPLWCQALLIPVVYALQLRFAVFWLQRYPQGILEAFWRNLARKKERI